MLDRLLIFGIPFALVAGLAWFAYISWAGEDDPRRGEVSVASFPPPQPQDPARMILRQESRNRAIDSRTILLGLSADSRYTVVRDSLTKALSDFAGRAETGIDTSFTNRSRRAQGLAEEWAQPASRRIIINGVQGWRLVQLGFSLETSLLSSALAVTTRNGCDAAYASARRWLGSAGSEVSDATRLMWATFQLSTDNRLRRSQLPSLNDFLATSTPLQGSRWWIGENVIAYFGVTQEGNCYFSWQRLVGLR